jgi:ribosomal protein S18 acetylase RimI-like enzyme
MDIRILTPDDAAEWWRLRQESLARDPEAFGASIEDEHTLSVEEVRRRLAASREEFFIVGALDHGQLAGMAGFYREKSAKGRHKGGVWGVYVTPAHRGQGLARMIFEALLGHAAAIPGVEQILISVATTQAAAAKLYRSLGFETYGREPRALKVGGRYIDEELMLLRFDKSASGDA